jgi:hypothetical protein
MERPGTTGDPPALGRSGRSLRDLRLQHRYRTGERGNGDDLAEMRSEQASDRPHRGSAKRGGFYPTANSLPRSLPVLRAILSRPRRQTGAPKRRTAGGAAGDAAMLAFIGNAAPDREECGEPRDCAALSTVGLRIRDGRGRTCSQACGCDQKRPKEYWGLHVSKSISTSPTLSLRSM